MAQHALSSTMTCDAGAVSGAEGMAETTGSGARCNTAGRGRSKGGSGSSCGNTHDRADGKDGGDGGGSDDDDVDGGDNRQMPMTPAGWTDEYGMHSTINDLSELLDVDEMIARHGNDGSFLGSPASLASVRQCSMCTQMGEQARVSEGVKGVEEWRSECVCVCE